MSNFKSTKGPWQVGERRGDFIYITHSDDGIGAISLNMAHVVARKSWRSEAEANAKLIAAAPELLEALERIIMCAENIGGEHVTGLMDLDNAVEFARMKLNKALGL